MKGSNPEIQNENTRDRLQGPEVHQQATPLLKKRRRLFLPHPRKTNALAPSVSPVCVLLCLCSSSLLVNLLPQYIQLHTKGRSPLCQRRWARRCDVLPYTLPQPTMWQMCSFFLPSPEPLRVCLRGTFTRYVLARSELFQRFYSNCSPSSRLFTVGAGAGHPP